MTYSTPAAHELGRAEKLTLGNITGPRRDFEGGWRKAFPV